MSILSGIVDWVQGNRAANAVYTGYNDAMQGVLKREDAANVAVPAAGEKAANVVNTATGVANDTIAGGLNKGVQLQQPYIDAGGLGVTGLSTPQPTFSWDPSQIANDPAFKFRMQQGQEAIQNNAAKTGLASSGNVLKDLTTFGSGTSAQFENEDFNRALSTFKTNQDYSMRRFEDLAGLGQHAADFTGNLYKDASGQIAKNDINAGVYEGDTGTSIAKFLASLNNTSAVQAGNYRIGQAGATAGKDLGTGKAINTIAGAVPDLFTTISGLFKPPGGG